MMPWQYDSLLRRLVRDLKRHSTDKYLAVFFLILTFQNLALPLQQTTGAFILA